MNPVNDELKYVLKLYNGLEYHKSLELALKLLERLDSSDAESDISDRLNLIISKILFLQGKYKESIGHVDNCRENEQTLLMRAKIFSVYDCYMCKSAYYWLLIYNDKYMSKFIDYCLKEADLGFLYILSVYKPISAGEITNSLGNFVASWDYTAKSPLYKDLFYNYTYLQRAIEAEAQPAMSFDFDYANSLNSIISGLDEANSHRLCFTSESPIAIVREFIDFIVKHGLNVKVEFKLKSRSSIDHNASYEESKSINRGSRDSYRRQKTIESTHWHSLMPLKLFNTLGKLVSYGDTPKDAFDILSRQQGEVLNNYNIISLNKVIKSTFKRAGLSGFIAFKLFVNILFRYNFNSILCTNAEVELIIALITLYKMLDNCINNTVSFFSHPLLSCIYMENTRVPSVIELLWTKFHRLDIFKFMLVMVKAVSLNKIGYPIPMSEILSVSDCIAKNTLPSHSFIVVELNAFVIIVHRWNELLQDRVFYDGLNQRKTSLALRNNCYPIGQSVLFDYFIRTHIPILCTEKLSRSFVDKISKIHGFGSNFAEIKGRCYTKLLNCISHQIKLFSAEKFGNNDDIHQLLTVANTVMDKAVYHLVTRKFLNYGNDLLVACFDLFTNVTILLVENQLKMHDSFNNPNWMTNREFCSIDVRLGGQSLNVICNFIFKVFILVEQFDFRRNGVVFVQQLQKMASLSSLLIHYELFNLLYIKHHNISSKLDFEQSHMLVTLLVMLIISSLIKSGIYDKNLINVLGVLLQVDHVYRELIDDMVDMTFVSDESHRLSFKWGFYNTIPNLFSYPISKRVIHVPSYIINVCTFLYTTRLISSYSAELQLLKSNPFNIDNVQELDEVKEVELDNWISISFAQTYAINIYIGIPSPFDKSREKIKKYDKLANIPFFKMDMRSCIMAVHIHRYLNGLEMVGTDVSLDSAHYIASHDNTTIENRDLIVSLCEALDSFINADRLENVMSFKSLRVLYLNLLVGTKLDDPIRPYEKLFFNANVTNINDLLSKSYNALEALPMSHDAVFANIILRIKECMFLVERLKGSNDSAEFTIRENTTREGFLREVTTRDSNTLESTTRDSTTREERTATADKSVGEKFEILYKLLEVEICKYASSKRIIGPRELSDEQDNVLEDEFRMARLEKCYKMYIALVLMNDQFLNDQINICLSYSFNVLSLISLNGLPKGHSLANPNFMTSILNSIGRIKWNIARIVENHDFLTVISTLMLVGKFLRRVYECLNIQSVLKVAMALYIKALEIAFSVTFSGNAAEFGKMGESYFTNLLGLLESKTGDSYHVAQYCYAKCLKLMFRYPAVAISNVREIVQVIIENNSKYPNMAGCIAAFVKYNDTSSLSANGLLQALSASYNIIIYFDIFGYGLIKHFSNDNERRLITPLKVMPLLVGKYVGNILESVEGEIARCMDEFSAAITNYVAQMPDESNTSTFTIKGNSTNLGKGRWMVTGYEYIEKLESINLALEATTAILGKIVKRHSSSEYYMERALAIVNDITEKLELLVSKCPETLSLPLTYNHFLSKSDCNNLIELIKNGGSDKSMFSKYTIDTATIDIRLVKNLKLLLAVVFKMNAINKSKVYDILCNTFIMSCQKILYCQPPIDAIDKSNPLLDKFVKIDIREDVTVFASDTWAMQQKLNSFRQAITALSSSATTPPHTL